MSKCKSCNKSIKWIVTESGKKTPVNIEEITVIPNKDGQHIIIAADGRAVKGDLTMSGTPGAIKGNVSHFSTCPQAEKWRKR